MNIKIPHKDILIEEIKEKIKCMVNYCSVVESLPHIRGTDVPETKIKITQFQEILLVLEE